MSCEKYFTDRLKSSFEDKPMKVIIKKFQKTLVNRIKLCISK